MTSRRDHAPGTLEARLAGIESRITRACGLANRQRAEVTMVAVSKRHPASAIRSAYALGVRDFAENYVQELKEKQAALADLDEIRWHFIGTLQRNKAQKIVGACALIHSVGTLRLIDRIAALCRPSCGQQSQKDSYKGPGRQPILIQVNLAGETQKGGFGADELPQVFEHIDQRPEIFCAGLMTMPPRYQNPEDAATHFRRLSEAAETYPNQCGQTLSMGMSHDFEVAIREGSNLIRIGSALFGTRPERKEDNALETKL